MQRILKYIPTYQSIQLSYNQEEVEWLDTLNLIISHIDSGDICTKLILLNI